jgi:ribosomal protein L40E
VDTDLFQTLAVALLGVIALLLLVATVMLGRLRRAIEDHIPSGALESLVLAAETSTAPAGAGLEPSAQGERVEERMAPAATEPTREEAAASAGTGDLSTDVSAEPERDEERAAAAVGASAGAREMHAGEAAQEERDEAERVEEPAGVDVSSGLEDYEDEPQEQPFERDGRWWFRRGDELLVYDEQTGQWMPAPTRTAGGSAGASTYCSGAVATEPRSSDLGGREARAEESQNPSSSFWKCPSCGAVNGSTATSCRMCFTPRP